MYVCVLPKYYSSPEGSETFATPLPGCWLLLCNEDLASDLQLASCIDAVLGAALVAVLIAVLIAVLFAVLVAVLVAVFVLQSLKGLDNPSCVCHLA